MEHKSTGWLSEKEVAQVEPAETVGFGSPIPTQIVSNGEYNPLPQTEKQRQVEGLIKEFADKYGKRQGMDRRTFLRSASGMAAAFLAMNEVFGPLFDVSPAEAQTLAFTTLVLFQLVNVFAARSETQSAARGLGRNPWLFGAVLTSVLLQVAVVQWPPLQRAFRTAPLSARDWLASLAVASSVLWLGELRKLLRRRLGA
jgi:magnesium-transporting ATPase (P-type)